MSPLANGVHNSWERLISGQSGIAKLEGFDTDDLAVQIGGQVPTKIDDSIDEHSVFFNPNAYIEKREQKINRAAYPEVVKPSSIGETVLFLLV